MTDGLSIGLTKLLRKAAMDHDVDFLREGVRVFSQALMELEVTQHIGAERHARTEARTGQRNGYRERRWDTRVGTVDLRVPRVRDGGYFAVMQEAYVLGASMTSSKRSASSASARARSRDYVKRWIRKSNASARDRSSGRIRMSGWTRPT
jgi:putative transposase